jgi:hypothetical protein
MTDLLPSYDAESLIRYLQEHGTPDQPINPLFEAQIIVMHTSHPINEIVGMFNLIEVLETDLMLTPLPPDISRILSLLPPE